MYAARAALASRDRSEDTTKQRDRQTAQESVGRKLLCCFSSSLPAARARAAARCLGSGVRRTLSVTYRPVVASPSRGHTLGLLSQPVTDSERLTVPPRNPYAGSQSGSVSQSEKKNLIRGGGVSARAHSRLVTVVRCLGPVCGLRSAEDERLGTRWCAERTYQSCMQSNIRHTARQLAPSGSH